MNQAAPASRPHLPNRRVLFALAVTCVMVLSSALIAAPGNARAETPTATAFMAGSSMHSGVLTGAELQHSTYATSPGSGMTAITNGTILGNVAGSSPVAFTIGFALQNESELTQILAAQASEGSPMFQHWLTLQQENQMFGPNPVEVQNTINYFTSLGFRVATEGPISISFIGPAASTNAAFKTTLVNVKENGATAITNAAPLSLPGQIANGISTVNGLNQLNVAHVTSFVDPALTGDMAASLAMTPSDLSTSLSTPTTYLNTSQAYNFTNAAFLWFRYFSMHHKAFETWQTITPGSLDKIYGAYPLLNAGINGNSTGSPITVALVMAGGINPSDIQEYGQLVFNNPKAIFDRLVPVPVDGSFTDNGTLTYTDGDSNEMALDIDYSATMALGAKIMPVYGPCLCTNVLDDDYATIDAMLKVPNVVSNSWGGEEDTFGNLYGPNWQNTLTMHHYFMLLDARGVTILASSADGGGFDTGTGMLSGAFPATDPYVLSVDGTRAAETDGSGVAFPYTDSLGLANLTIDTLINWPVHVEQATQLQYQSFWYQPIANTTLYNAPPEASGGFGTSYWFNQSWYQNGIGVPNLGRALGSGVGAEADFNETIYFDGGIEYFYGGTSFACPTTAGMFGLIDDYLLDHGHSAYLGDGNVPVFTVGNAWLNGNLSLVPYYDVVNNGTSYWGNYGVEKGYSWPPGQKFPMSPQGYTTYGNTTKGWDFPTGWGSINVANFATDLAALESLPGTFQIINTTTNSFNVGAWDYMVLNQSYTVHLNASASFGASNPTVTVEFFAQNGQKSTMQFPLTAVFTPTLGFNFVLDTSISPFNGPGLIIFESGNDSTHTAGFAYTWISWPAPPGTLTVTVVDPQQSSEVGGYAQFNPWPFGYDAPVSVSPSCCTAYPNSFTVQVTFNGHAVYNAQVDATVPSASVLAWQGSPIQGVTQGDGRPSHELTSAILSQTFTNTSGYALVYTWNVIAPTSYFVNATYGSAIGGTTYTMTPGPNVGTTDDYGGNYSELNTVAFVLKQIRQTVNPTTENYWAPNSVYQSAYYDMLYTWQGEELPVHTSDYQGNALGGLKVWFGNYDVGGENKFYKYIPSGGSVGVTNTSGTSAITGGDGNATVYIPQNQSLDFFVYTNGTPAFGFGFVSASIPGVQNRTFSYTEPCAPTLVNPKTTITCQYNDSFQRNYTSVPAVVFPDPVKAWTDTTSKVQRDFFGEGASVAAAVSIHLPTGDPFITGIGYNWPSGLEHVVSANAYVDGVYAGTMSPNTPPDWQTYNSTVNLTGTYGAGNHTLEVIVDDSLGHVFTSRHTFIVGGVTVPTLRQYTVLPYNLTWTLDIPYVEMNNHTFNQTLDIRYVTNGCGGSLSPCPTVVNYTERIRDGVVNYYQLLNLTLLNLNHFYGGSSTLPAGQYQLIIWLNANHSGSIATELSTYLVFNPVVAHLNGPTANETVPIGNVTLSYSYSGQYIQAANLSVYSAADLQVPVFNVIAYVPGDGLRGGAANWIAVDQGPYRVTLALGTPYGWDNITENITVLETTGLVWLNQSSAAHPLGGMGAAETGTILALVAGILGLLIGLWIAPSFRRMPTGPSGKGSTKPWEEGPAGATSAAGRQAGRITCPVCKDEFSTEFALHEHQKIVHGIEE
ncbi:MAG: hypothetical protein L3K17_01125 [Thermoplasmata archaeon]|nr:hypothetical protein [Thermoplasmata archaeon]